MSYTNDGYLEFKKKKERKMAKHVSVSANVFHTTGNISLMITPNLGFLGFEINISCD